MPFYFFIFDFIILVVMLLFCSIQKNQNEIIKSHIKVHNLFAEIFKEQEEKFLQKIKNLEARVKKLEENFEKNSFENISMEIGKTFK